MDWTCGLLALYELYIYFDKNEVYFNRFNVSIRKKQRRVDTKVNIINFAPSLQFVLFSYRNNYTLVY